MDDAFRMGGFEHLGNLPADLEDPVDGSDVRMVQRGEELGFALEVRPSLRVGGR